MLLLAEFDREKALALVAVGAALAMILIRKLRVLAAEEPCDPWPQEVDLAVRARDAIPLCVDCLYPQEGRPWFCPHCGFPTGDQVTRMPYLQVFAIGEVLRRGVTGPPEKGFFRQVFLVFYSASQYAFFAPIYWFWMARKAFGKPICHRRREELKFEENA